MILRIVLINSQASLLKSLSRHDQVWERKLSTGLLTLCQRETTIQSTEVTVLLPMAMSKSSLICWLLLGFGMMREEVVQGCLIVGGNIVILCYIVNVYNIHFESSLTSGLFV